MASNSHIDWSVDASILRRKLRILSTKKLKQLCKSCNILYSTDKLETIERLVNGKNTSITNELETKTNDNTETKRPDTPRNYATQSTNEFKENEKSNVVLKVGMLGDGQIGITSLMVKYIEDRYNEEDYIDTRHISVNFMEKTIHLKNVNVTISIWIIRNSQTIPLVCSDAKAIIFGFDLTNKASLFSVKRWYKEARKENKYFMPFLVGTKYDLYEEMNVDYKINITKQARKFASKMHSPLIYCSSAQSINIKMIFKLIIAKCFDLKPKMKEFHGVNEAIFEWTSTADQNKNKKQNKEQTICIVYGYIRQIQEFECQYAMHIYDFANIVLLFYANIIIGRNNKETKLKYRTHKKMRRKIRIMEREKLIEEKLKKEDEVYTICIVEDENKENAS